MLGMLVVLLFSMVVIGLTSSPCQGETLPADTTLEVRLTVATGSRISHIGDPVEGTIIAPVFANGQLVVPPGATVSGTVDRVQRLGLGLKNLTAGIRYRFDTLRLPNGKAIPVETQLVEVETAKERVNSDGSVGGIYPTANLSSTVSFYIVPALYLAPAAAVPVLGVKFLIARSPDPEIYFPPGTEMILRLTSAAEVNNTTAASEFSSFSMQEVADLRQFLQASSLQQAQKSGRRPSDLVNILFLGKRDEIDRAFRAAGWSGAQRRSAMSLYRSYHSLVQRIGYTMAPMDRLTLNGRPPTATFQKSLNTCSKRHHLRLWQASAEQPTVWLSAATEDVDFKFRGMHLTHITDARIDNERSKVVNDLAFTGCVDAATLLPRESAPGASKRRGSIVTDGSIAIVRLNECRNPRVMPAIAPPRHGGFMRAMIALRDDVERSNIVFLGYNTVKLFTRSRESQSAAHNANCGSTGCSYRATAYLDPLQRSG